MVAEHYLRYWRDTNGLNYTALRYGNVYGPHQDPNGEAGVIAIFARRMLAHEPVPSIGMANNRKTTSTWEM